MQATVVGIEPINSNWPSTHHHHHPSPQPLGSTTALDSNKIPSPSPSPSSDSDDESETPPEFSSLPVHADGVPRSDTKLLAKKYRTREFAQAVFDLLTTQLELPGWLNLPHRFKTSISISKVSGSLTNAVFFVSCPISPSSSLPIDPSKASNPIQPNSPDHPSPPTVLLRIYGPSSGMLISRQEELHLLHTLSARYGIGPLLLGTFYNGRVEQFFRSRPLTKEEVRDPQISTWIARKMSELHSVDLLTVITPGQDPRAYSQSSRRTNSITNDPKFIYQSISSPSSSYHTSPVSTPQLRSLNSNRDSNKAVGTATNSKSVKAGVWLNIIRWQHEATKVFADIITAFSALGLQVDSEKSFPSPSSTGEVDPLDRFRSTPPPLSSPEALLKFVQTVDLPRLILEMKSYRVWISNHERINGKSPRVFSHNDTQCGNLLLRQDSELLNHQPHDQIMVIDFEYASANPRGFDIANHFHEWCADYHHPTLSYSMTSHGDYPTYPERKRFYAAYLGIDRVTCRSDSMSSREPKRFKDSEISEFDLDEHMSEKEMNLPTPTSNRMVKQSQEEEDYRALLLEEEVSIWSPASHAMWALWGLVQARDDLKIQLDRWLTIHSDSDRDNNTNNNEEFEFDYFSYSAERIILFRKLLADMEIPII